MNVIETKKGRPTIEPKNLNTRVRLSEEDIKRLNYCSEKLSITKAEVIRLGINEIYQKNK